MEERVFNFSAGPAQMPVEVLEKAQREMLCYPGAGCSVLEMSHRTEVYRGILERASDTLKRLMRVPDDYAILFLQGGASLQFSMTVMNLTCRDETAAYAVTGHFANKAFEEGKRWCSAVKVSDSSEDGFTRIPRVEQVPEKAGFLHITGNNTIYGTAYRNIEEKLPETVLSREGKPSMIPLVADWSSAILGQEIDVSRYGLIYAGAQKNLGPAGLTVVIIRKDLLKKEKDPLVPTMLRYDIHEKNGSMYNTPPTFSIYLAGLMFEWVEKQGGVAEMEKRNRRKSDMLYEMIENSRLFSSCVVPEDRSVMNVVFRLPDERTTEEFLSLAKKRGMISLKGHRLTGGLRASLYNGMPEEGVKKLIDTMKEFELSR